MVTRSRKLDPARLLAWSAQGLTAEGIQRALEAEGTTAGLDLIRLRLREAKREANGSAPATPTPKAPRRSSSTARRTGQLTQAGELLESLREDLQSVLDGWGDSFAESDRSQRFQAAVEALDSITADLAGLDVSW